MKFRIESIENIPLSSLLKTLTSSLKGSSETTQKTESFWKWKHQSSPFGPSWGIAAVDPETEEIAGLRVLLNWHLINEEGEKARAVRAVDTATHPDYRRMGIFSMLTQNAIEALTKEGVDIIFNTPNNLSKPGYIKMGWEEVGRWPVYLNLQRPVSFVFGLIKGKIFTPSKTTPIWKEVYSPEVLSFNQLLESFGTSRLSAFFSHIDENASSVKGWRTPRSFDYVRWRYGEHPAIDYGFVAIRNGEDLSGLAVLRRNRRFGMKEMILADLFLEAGEATEEAAHRLLKNAKRFSRSDYMIAHYNLHTPELKFLRRARFVKASDQGMDFTVRALASSANRFNRQEQWNLSLGDLEMF